ncbi:hypothetical protein LCGC14_0955430 [marine sediment metagenome]|uniref:Uncharacterized protein n=1 Tax=marine sediment metagenome TaxID=412755 RepID=A0A0F9NFZ9_9ZZZZ
MSWDGHDEPEDFITRCRECAREIYSQWYHTDHDRDDHDALPETQVQRLERQVRELQEQVRLLGHVHES